MTGRRVALYWDTCVFLAWIKQETCWSKDIMDGIQQTVDGLRDRQIVLVTSSITLLEIYSSRLSVGQKDDLRKVFSRPEVDVKDVDRRIAAKASVIRQHYDNRVFGPDGEVISGRVIGMGDSIHLATALQYSVSEFQTLDGRAKKPQLFSLLSLGDEVVGARLSIRVPKYIPPPVFSSQPIKMGSGMQPSLFPQLDGESNVDMAALQEVIAFMKRAIAQGSFREDRKAATEDL